MTRTSPTLLQSPVNDAEARELIDAIARILRPHLRQSEPLRKVAHLVGQWLLEEAEKGAGSSSEATVSTSGTEEVRALTGAAGRMEPASMIEARPASHSGVPRASADVPRGIVPLRIGDATAHIPVPGTTEEIGRARLAGQAPYDASEEDEPRDTREIDLALVEQRARLKADSCRLFLDGLRSSLDPVRQMEHRERVRDMIGRAKELHNCFLWVFFPDREQPGPEVVREIAACYDALARAVALVRRIDGSGSKGGRDALERAVQMLAEADSALRIALQATWLTSPDIDQDEIHAWLKRETYMRRIYIERHMKLEDPADPAGAPDLIERIAALDAEVGKRIRAAKEIEKHFSAIRYHVRQLEGAREDEVPRHHEKIAEAVRALIEAGIPATDRRIAEAVGSRVARDLLDRLPELAPLTREPESTDRPEAPAPREWSRQVLEVRSLLSGRRMVIVGGVPRRDAIERLQQAFDLESVDWVELSEHGSGEPMRPSIRRPETAIVIVLVKLVGHLHADMAKEIAREAGKPCVFLRAGYNPEQVADAILQQRSIQLADAARD